MLITDLLIPVRFVSSFVHDLHHCSLPECHRGKTKYTLVLYSQLLGGGTHEMESTSFNALGKRFFPEPQAGTLVQVAALVLSR